MKKQLDLGNSSKLLGFLSFFGVVIISIFLCWRFRSRILLGVLLLSLLCLLRLSWSSWEDLVNDNDDELKLSSIFFGQFKKKTHESKNTSKCESDSSEETVAGPWWNSLILDKMVVQVTDSHRELEEDGDDSHSENRIFSNILQIE